MWCLLFGIWFIGYDFLLGLWWLCCEVSLVIWMGWLCFGWFGCLGFGLIVEFVCILRVGCCIWLRDLAALVLVLWIGCGF